MNNLFRNLNKNINILIKMKINNVEQDNENIPIKLTDNLESNNYDIIYQKK